MGGGDHPGPLMFFEFFCAFPWCVLGFQDLMSLRDTVMNNIGVLPWDSHEISPTTGGGTQVTDFNKVFTPKD